MMKHLLNGMRREVANSIQFSEDSLIKLTKLIYPYKTVVILSSQILAEEGYRSDSSHHF